MLAPCGGPFYGYLDELDVTDFYCGAGGSSTGLREAGFTIKVAANHWPRAIFSAPVKPAPFVCAGHEINPLAEGPARLGSILRVTATKFLDDLSLDGMLVALAVEADANSLDFSHAVRREGWESVVVETRDWIIRFPRHRDHARFATELAVLAYVSGRLPVETPEVAWTGEHTCCMAYPKIIGTEFTPKDWHAASDVDRRKLTDSLADLLIAWREALTGADVSSLGVTSIGGVPYVGQLTSSLASFPPAMRPAIENLLTEYSALYERDLAHGGAIVLHGDFHLGNMVLDGRCGAVTGLWDFSCVATGAFTWDLHYLAGEVSDPAEDLSPPGTGEHLDLLAGVLARLSNIVTSPEANLMLSDLMQCAEWIGDHDPQESLHWKRWLDQLAL
ncbi:phosphotransferase [Microlunatus parietis]|uniref:Aminoglycoside phosphotransferase domain-containing protein n=1 Tax=Microlunatus parietis TaxID=682979 RepID=A0A7Y9I7X1_9ACTN|nr:phosphotransferase [Microlunatus parietis]NYE71885.1 hypothetical protein [Microlunatus parietis]